MSWKSGLILAVITMTASALYYRFMIWAAKKAGVSFPTGAFRKFTFENYTGNVPSAARLHGRHELCFFARKKPSQILFEVVLTRGSLTLEFQDKAGGTMIYTWRNGDPGTFLVSIQPGQTLAFRGQALHFTGSITYRPPPKA